MVGVQYIIRDGPQNDECMRVETLIGKLRKRQNLSTLSVLHAQL
jgi:hypothetical protein